MKDISAGTLWGDPRDITAIGGGRAVFRADDGTHGYELWVTDGTAEGTALVKDIFAGAAGSNPSDFTALGEGRTVFRAYDDTHGAELWITYGTAQGTARVKDIFAGASGSNPSDFTMLDGGAPLVLQSVEDEALVVLPSQLVRAYADVDGDALSVTDLFAAGGNFVTGRPRPFQRRAAPPTKHPHAKCLADVGDNGADAAEGVDPQSLAEKIETQGRLPASLAQAVNFLGHMA